MDIVFLKTEKSNKCYWNDNSNNNNNNNNISSSNNNNNNNNNNMHCEITAFLQHV